MPLGLHAATVPQFQKMLANVRDLLSKAEAHCAAEAIAPEEIIQARLAPDMLPFAYQIKSAAVHSIGAIEGVRNGVFAPDTTPPGDSFAALHDRIKTAQDALAALVPEEIDGFEGRPMRFEIKAYHADFSAEQFLLTFSLPNFYFHVTTAYDILRTQGLPLGKLDYIGAIPLQK